MRSRIIFCLMLLAPMAHSVIEPETVGRTELKKPTPSWFIVKSSSGPAYLYDGADGEMLGLLSLTDWTPAVEPNVRRGEIYAAETYYSRGIRGERSDVVTVYDLKTLTPVAEIKVPNKIAALVPFRHYIGLLDDARHLAVFNLTPAQSVTIVDVRDRQFVGEISTPGCALIMPSPDRSFLMMCGDGSLQLIRLDRRGAEVARVRSDVFFSVEKDPIFDRPVKTDGGWSLVSFDGNVFDVSVEDDTINVSESWSILDKDKEEMAGWRIGGSQVMTLHRGTGLLYTLMHKGKKDTHDDAGTEIWVYDKQAKRRIGRIELKDPVRMLYVSQEDKPTLIVGTQAGKIQMFEGRALKLIRTIDQPGAYPGLLQGF